jgi:hypothetical protein
MTDGSKGPVKTKAQPQRFQARVTGEAQRPLSPACAFVVHFREGTEPTSQDFTGRVEHMISGDAARFQSSDELMAFFVRVMRAVRTKPPQPR